MSSSPHLFVTDPCQPLVNLLACLKQRSETETSAMIPTIAEVSSTNVSRKGGTKRWEEKIISSLEKFVGRHRACISPPLHLLLALWKLETMQLVFFQLCWAFGRSCLRETETTIFDSLSRWINGFGAKSIPDQAISDPAQVSGHSGPGCQPIRARRPIVTNNLERTSASEPDRVQSSPGGRQLRLIYKVSRLFL